MRNRRRLIVHLIAFIISGFISVMVLKLNQNEVIKTIFALCIGYIYCYIDNPE